MGHATRTTCSRLANADPARQARDRAARHDRRNPQRLGLPSLARGGGRFRRRPHPALLGRRVGTAAVDQAINIYNQLAPGLSRQADRDRRVRLAERRLQPPRRVPGHADPGGRAARIRQSRAEALGIDYNIIEAYDQPWKTFEGGVGPYWGFFDAARQPKFSWTGPIANPDHWKLTAIAVAIGVLLSLPILALAGATFGQAALLAAAAHTAGAWIAILFAYWNGHYFVPGAAFAFGVRAACC